jgi:hypothetical protein
VSFAPKPTARVLLVTAFILTVALVPWPGLGAAFTRAFCAVGNAAASLCQSHPPLRFEFEPAAGHSWSTTVVVRDSSPGGGSVDVFNLYLRVLVYAPLSLFVALSVAAAEADRRAHARAFAIGLAMVLGLLGLAIVSEVTVVLSHVWAAPTGAASQRVHLVQLGPAASWVLSAVYRTISSCSYVFVVAIWAFSRWWLAPAAWPSAPQASA